MNEKATAGPILAVIIALLVIACLPKGNASEKAVLQTGTASMSDQRFNLLFNQLRIENAKVEDLPLDQFVEKISKEFKELDPGKKGINFVLKLPAGEPAIPVSLDFTEILKYRANVEMILEPIKARYPIRYKIDQNASSVYIEQLSRDEINFDKMAGSTFADVDFHDTDAATALKAIQASAKNHGFAFDLDLKAINAPDSIRTLPTIKLKAQHVSVGQALRSVFYLANLRAAPLDRFAGYKVTPQSEEAVREGVCYFAGFTFLPTKMGSGEKDRLREQLAEMDRWRGPSITAKAFDRTNNRGVEIIQEQPAPNEGMQQKLTLLPKVIDKAHVQIMVTMEATDSHGKSMGKVSGDGILISGQRALVASSGSAAPLLQGTGKDPASGWVGAVEVMLVDAEGRSLLPPPSPVVGEIIVAPSPQGGAGPAASIDATKEPIKKSALTDASAKQSEVHSGATPAPALNIDHGAGLEVSPAVRDFLGLSGADVTSWRFVDYQDVPAGPWSKYGDKN